MSCHQPKTSDQYLLGELLTFSKAFETLSKRFELSSLNFSIVKVKLSGFSSYSLDLMMMSVKSSSEREIWSSLHFLYRFDWIFGRSKILLLFGYFSFIYELFLSKPIFIYLGKRKHHFFIFIINFKLAYYYKILALFKLNYN